MWPLAAEDDQTSQTCTADLRLDASEPGPSMNKIGGFLCVCFAN